ncbi:MAG: addiction module protein, partial [Dolichospermum sp.]
FQLPESDRLELVRAIIESLQNQPSQKSERTRIIKQMKGLLKTNQPAPTDENKTIVYHNGDRKAQPSS